MVELTETAFFYFYFFGGGGGAKIEKYRIWLTPIMEKCICKLLYFRMVIGMYLGQYWISSGKQIFLSNQLNCSLLASACSNLEFFPLLPFVLHLPLPGILVSQVACTKCSDLKA